MRWPGGETGSTRGPREDGGLVPTSAAVLLGVMLLLGAFHAFAETEDRTELASGAAAKSFLGGADQSQKARATREAANNARLVKETARQRNDEGTAKPMEAIERALERRADLHQAQSDALNKAGQGNEMAANAASQGDPAQAPKCCDPKKEGAGKMGGGGEGGMVMPPPPSPPPEEKKDEKPSPSPTPTATPEPPSQPVATPSTSGTSPEVAGKMEELSREIAAARERSSPSSGASASATPSAESSRADSVIQKIQQDSALQQQKLATRAPSVRARLTATPPQRGFFEEMEFNKESSEEGAPTQEYRAHGQHIGSRLMSILLRAGLPPRRH